MKRRFRLYCRKKSGRYYIHDDQTGKQESLHTSDRATATRLLHAKNEASQQPAINLQIARAYLMASDPLVATRTWQHVMNEIVKTKLPLTAICAGASVATETNDSPRPSTARRC